MDDPTLDGALHAGALRGLARINTLSLASSVMWRHVRRVLAGRTRATLLDVAAGSGDVTIGLARLARRHGLSLDLTACDVSPFALDRARERAERSGFTLATARADGLADTLPSADVVVCSLFLHHLAGPDVERALAAMKKAARVGLIVSDLRRSAAGTALARVVPRLLTASPVVHVDAVRSARAALSPDELRAHARRAGLGGAVVEAAVPSRMILRWAR